MGHDLLLSENSCTKDHSHFPVRKWNALPGNWCGSCKIHRMSAHELIAGLCGTSAVGCLATPLSSQRFHASPFQIAWRLEESWEEGRGWGHIEIKSTEDLGPECAFATNVSTWQVEILTAAVGPPSDPERQYRALLWLHHHRELSLICSHSQLRKRHDKMTSGKWVAQSAVTWSYSKRMQN